MNRILKSLSVLSLLLLMSLTLTGIASADVIKGIGWIHAEGAGTARLQMSGNIDIEGHGVGAVWRWDRSPEPLRRRSRRRPRSGSRSP